MTAKRTNASAAAYPIRHQRKPSSYMSSTRLVVPRSRGEVRLRSADPLAAAQINFNYLREQADVDALVAGTKLARALGQSTAYDALLG